MSTVDAIDTMEFAERIGNALWRDFGHMKAVAKVVARLARANERAAENWLAKRNAPGGRNLTYLMAESNAVFEEVMAMAGRKTEAEKEELARRLDEISKLLPSRNAPN